MANSIGDRYVGFWKARRGSRHGSPDDLVSPLPRHIIPLPTPRRLRAQVRTRLNRTYTKYRAEIPAPDERAEPDRKRH